MGNRKAGLILLMVLCSFLVSIPIIERVKAESNTIVVRDDYGHIQDAINNASEGDTIYVKKGTYHENLVINKSISLIGEDLDTTIIDGAPSEGFRIPIKIQCDNVAVSGFKILYGYTGISMWDVKNCTISGNRIAGGQHGIELSSSEYNNITGNIFESIGLSSAIRLYGASHNFVCRNHISSCVEGIQLIGSHDNTVTENTIKDCMRVTINVGIRLQNSDRNTVIRNNITRSGTGLTIYASNNNTIYHNNFLYNDVQISANEWYALTFGHNVSVNTINENYWSDYNGTDTDGDGIGNTPYIIDENNQDNNPLIEPAIIPEFPSWTILPLLLAATLVIIGYKKRLTKNSSS